MFSNLEWIVMISDRLASFRFVDVFRYPRASGF